MMWRLKIVSEPQGAQASVSAVYRRAVKSGGGKAAANEKAKRTSSGTLSL
jgi:hypothetical protein